MHMVQDYYLGVDGGGSNTRALVADAKGNIITCRTGLGINFYAAGMEKSRENLHDLVHKLEECIDIRRLKGAFFGNAAIDHLMGDDEAAAYKSGILDCKVSVHSDAFIALSGHTLGTPGCLVISGTGSVAVAKNSQEQYRQFGGWGYLLGDEGSAYDIAIKAYRAVVHFFDGIGEATMLVDRVVQKYDLQEPYTLLETINPRLSKREIAAFSQEVKECAEKGDAVALKILEQSARYLAELAAAAASFAGVSTVGIYGSVLLNDRFVREHFEKLFARHIPGGIVVEPQLPPMGGAVLLAMAEDGIAANKEIIDNLIQGIAAIK